MERNRTCIECHEVGPWLLRRTQSGQLFAACGACIASEVSGLPKDVVEAGSLFAYTNAPPAYDYEGIVIGSNALGVVEGHPCRTWNGPWRLVETVDDDDLVRQQLDRYNSGLYGAMRTRLFEEEVAPYLNTSEVPA